MPTIESASRSIPKATYVPLEVDVGASQEGGAVVKFGYVRNLQLQPDEVEAVQNSMDAFLEDAADTTAAVYNAGFWDVLRMFEGAPIPSQLPSPKIFASVPAETLTLFGKGLTRIRQQALNRLKQSPGISHTNALEAVGIFDAALMSTSVSPHLGSALNLLNTSMVATKSFEANVAATPIGMLNLERVEMTPAGIERGELLATIPLAPQEKTAVVHKEWSVTSREFTSIVTDSLENYSEKGVTENTEMAESTNSQVQHSNQFNINATVSGSYGFVTSSIATSFGSQDSSSLSAAASRKHAASVTQKASSRVKQEHKTTISTLTVTGTSESTTRILENPSSTNPIRIDYFSLMRKWRVRLYRYGLRLTYDISIPEPGAALREIYAELAKLQIEQSKGFEFHLRYEDITPDKLPELVEKYGAQLPAPPAPGPKLTPNQQVPGLDNSETWHFSQLTFTVPDGYWITKLTVDALVGIGTGFGDHHFIVLGSGYDKKDHEHGYHEVLTTPQYGNFMLHYTGTHNVTFFLQWADVAWIGLVVETESTPENWLNWKKDVWSACYNAAQQKFYEYQQEINGRIQVLQDKISGVDTLTLRREESDEIMKNVLRWLLGTGFEFMPQAVIDLFKGAGGDLEHGVNFTGNDLGINKPEGWATMFRYQEMVKFINQAIEWENVLYFLYPYFWDVPLSWDFIRQIRHPDATRQAFLRAGSARVVLTVRKGYEKDWTSFVEMGEIGHNHRYMSIAEEIQAYDDRNYPGIPPANPGGKPPSSQDTVTTASNEELSASTSPVTITVDSSAGFVAGAKIIIDTYESGVQETQTIVDVPDSTHISVQQLHQAHDGTLMKFPLVQPGEKGILIAEWNEYTPTSGTDIEVTSNLTNIA